MNKNNLNNTIETVTIDAPFAQNYWDTMYNTSGANTITSGGTYTTKPDAAGNIYTTTTGTSGNIIFQNVKNTNTHFGDMQIVGKLDVNGVDIAEALEKIQERLAILQPNMELEERWTKLKELRQQYMELEKDILSQEKVHQILKGS